MKYGIFYSNYEVTLMHLTYIYSSGTWEILKKGDAPSLPVLINPHFLLNSDNIVDPKILLCHTEIQDHSCKSCSQLTNFTAGKEWS